MSYSPNFPQPGGDSWGHYNAPPFGGFQMPSAGPPSFPTQQPYGNFTPPSHDGYSPSYDPPPHSYAPPTLHSYAPAYAPPSGPPPAMYGGTSMSSAPPFPPHQAQLNQFAQSPQRHDDYQQQGSNVIYYLNTAIPPPIGGPGQESAPAVAPGYDANADFEKVRKATKGFGTDENLLTSTLAPLSALQLAVLATTFRAGTGKKMVEVLYSETSGFYRDLLFGLALGPLWYDVELVNTALRGAGTDEHLLTEILVDRTPADIYHLSIAYQQKYHRSLEDEISCDLSGKTERLFRMLLSSQRPLDNVPVDNNEVQADVKALFQAAQGKLGTDEISFCNIIVNRSRPHLTALWDLYQRQHGKTLAKVIKSEFSGHMKNVLLYIVNGINPKRINEGGPGVWRDAKLFESSMKGIGTNDKQLIRRIVRCHWDQQRFQAIKAAYERKYKKSLESRIVGEISGNYKKLAVAIVRGT